VGRDRQAADHLGQRAHYTAALYLLQGLKHVTDHFLAE